MRTALFLATLLLASTALAQEGTVRYEITTRLDIELPPEMQHMADQFPSTSTASKLLHFDETSSLLVAAPEADDEDEDFSSGRMRMMFRRSQAENALYVDRDAETSVEKRDFMGRTFLIDGAPEPLAWRLTDEQSEFLGYPCMKATAMRDTVAVEAWFTPQIPVSAGPDEYGGLPGLILVLTLDDARQTYIAEEITLEPLAEGTITKPTDGRRVTDEEFKALVKEKIEEMQKASGGRRGGFIIRG